MAQQGNGTSEETTVHHAAADRSPSRTVGHFLGRVVRKAVPVPRRWVDPRPVGMLLEELVELVDERGREHYRALERDARFWTLVEGLHAKRPKVVRRRRSGDAQAETDEAVSAASGEDVGLVDAQLADASEQDDEASATSSEPAQSEAAEPAGSEAAEPAGPAEEPAAAEGSASDEEPGKGASSAETGTETKEVDQ